MPPRISASPAAAIELLVALGMARKQATNAVSRAPAAEPDDTASDDAPAEPPAGAVQSEQLTVPPPPSAEDVKRAEEATRQVQEQATKLEQERKAREAEQAAATKAAEPAPGGHTVVVPVPVPGYVDDPTRVPLRPALPAGPARPVPARPPVRR